MLYINEWLPNPAGKDTNEFIELWNSGNGAVELHGWSLWTGGKTKPHVIPDTTIPAYGYAVFKKDQTKLSLKNSDGGLWLYGPNGTLVDYGMFSGAAPVGKSFSRADYGNAPIQHFAFADPTPGSANASIDTSVTKDAYPLGVPLNPPLGAAAVLGFMMSAAIIFGGLWVYLLHANENLAKFIFKENTGSR